MKQKRRYQQGDYPTWEHMRYGQSNFHQVLNLFVAHRWERLHPRHCVPTQRYREWLAKRDAPGGA